MILDQIAAFNIPVVDSHDPVTNAVNFLNSIRAIEGSEGVIIVWSDGHRVKVKGDWYIARHKAKDQILRENNVIEMLLDEKIDDIKPVLIEADRENLDRFEVSFWSGVSETAKQWKNINSLVHNQFGNGRKAFAVEMSATIDQYVRAAIFKSWDTDNFDFRAAVVDAIRKNISTSTKADAVRHLWGGAVWSYGMGVGEE